MLVVLLSRFWFDLAPAMGKPEAVQKNQQIALTLKIKGGLKLLCRCAEEGVHTCWGAPAACLRDGPGGMAPGRLPETGARTCAFWS